MKYLIASDLHGRVSYAEKLLAAIDREKPDSVILLGDFLYNGPRNGVPDDYEPMKTCEILKKIDAPVIGVRGNCDSRVDEMLLPFPIEDIKEIEINGMKAVLHHGDLFERSHIIERKPDLCLYGHTHIHLIENEGGVLFLNPGSLGFPKNRQRPSYATIEEKTISVKDLDSGETLVSQVANDPNA